MSARVTTVHRTRCAAFVFMALLALVHAAPAARVHRNLTNHAGMRTPVRRLGEEGGNDPDSVCDYPNENVVWTLGPQGADCTMTCKDVVEQQCDDGLPLSGIFGDDCMNAINSLFSQDSSFIDCQADGWVADVNAEYPAIKATNCMMNSNQGNLDCGASFVDSARFCPCKPFPVLDPPVSLLKAPYLINSGKYRWTLESILNADGSGYSLGYFLTDDDNTDAVVDSIYVLFQDFGHATEISATVTVDVHNTVTISNVSLPAVLPAVDPEIRDRFPFNGTVSAGALERTYYYGSTPTALVWYPSSSTYYWGSWTSEGASEDEGGDECPDDPYKTESGVCGCGTPDVDTDADGTPDCIDACPTDALSISCQCGTPDVDTDADGTPDCIDECPNNADLTCTAIVD